MKLFINFIVFVITFTLSSCMIMKENIIIDKMINKNYCIGHLDNNFIGLYKFNSSCGYGENNTKDTVVFWDQIDFTSSNIFVNNNLIIVEKKGKRKNEFNVFTVKNDSMIDKIFTNNIDTFFIKNNFYNITDSIRKPYRHW